MGFNIPNNNQITRRQPVSPSLWTRQGDWVSITGVSTGEIIFLASDATDAKYTIRTTSTGGGNIYIDWGDGSSPDTISTGGSTDTAHTYTTGGTACSLGYNTWKITITSDVGTRITGCQIVINSGQYTEYPSGLLEAWYGDTTITTASNIFSEQNAFTPWFTYLEYVKLPEGMTATDSLLRVFFNGCRMLKKVDMPTSCSANQTLQETFYECNSLIDPVVFPQDMTGVTRADQTFFNCYALQGVIYPPTFPNCTTISRVHQSNLNLGECYLPELPSCTTFGLAFNGCISLKSSSMPKWASSGTLDFTSMYTGCQTLKNITLPNDTPSTTLLTITTMFNTCYSLESVIFPPNAKLTGSLNNVFNQCTALIYVSLPTDASNVTTFANMFVACNSLQTIVLPSVAPSIAVSMASTFANCNSLDQVTIPSTYNITLLSTTFQNCRSLKSITLPNNSQNSLTTMDSMCDACSKLRTIVMPTSMTSLTTLANAFRNNFSLESVVFPSSLSALTSLSNTFQNCQSLETITLPTTLGNMAANFFGTFTNCNRLKQVTMPTTYGSLTSLGTVFQNCFSLKSVIFGTTQLTGITTISNAFNGCHALTGITNSDYIGNNSTLVGNVSYVNGTTTGTNSRSMQSLSFSCKFSKLELQGTTGTNNQSQLTSLRLLNNGAGQYAGTSPQINVSYTSMDATALNQLFTDLPTITSKTISVVGCPGAATCNTSIATAKGWTVTTV